MKHLIFMRLRFVFVILVLFVSFSKGQELASASPESLGFSNERLQKLGSLLESYSDNKQMAGNVVLILRHGKIAYFKASGSRDIEAKSPMTNDAIFRIASQTKALISVSIMILQEEGKLVISDPVSKYIPEFAETTVAESKTDGGYTIVKAKRKITLRDLLTHTAGIGYGGGVAADKWKAAGIQGWYFADRSEPVAATVARMGALPNDAQPGEKFVYGYNTDILGVVVEKVSGKPLDEFIASRITVPLGMNDTYFYLPNEKASRLATVYSLDNSKPLARAATPGTMVGQGAYLDGPRKSFSGGAGLLSTALDYAKFLQMMLNGGIYNGKRIISPNTVELMTSNHIGKLGNPGEGFGLGFSVCLDLGERGTPGSVGEFGWGGAYGSAYWVDPKQDMVVVYFKQLLPAYGVDDHSKLRTMIYAAIEK
jgi:CubicO group peptidase (beta-lactamase class C family)